MITGRLVTIVDSGGVPYVWVPDGPIATNGPNDPPFEVTAAQIEAAFAASDISEQEPFVAMGRMGLSLHQEADDGAA